MNATKKSLWMAIVTHTEAPGAQLQFLYQEEEPSDEAVLSAFRQSATDTASAADLMVDCLMNVSWELGSRGNLGALLAMASDLLPASEESKFVENVAAMSIWSYDKDDGDGYEECEEPDEGFLDSHCALMQLIETARSLPQRTEGSANIVVTIAGGVVGEVITDRPTNVLIVDHDTEGLDDDQLVCMPDLAGFGTVTVAKNLPFAAEFNPSLVAAALLTARNNAS